MSPKPPVFPTRERILAYLAENHVASAQALSRAWGLTRADIRYHLNALAGEGLVEIVPRDPKNAAGRGRPAQVYRLAAEKTANNLPALCGALLAALRLVTEERRAAAVEQIASQLADGFSPSANPTQRLNQAASFLSERGYRARWEAGLHGPRILLRGCPYAAVLPDHPELCGIDQAFLEVLTGFPLQHTARINPATGRPPACVFGSAGTT